MSNKQQTAVEWLVDKLMKGEFINNSDELIEKAKEKDKEEKFNFFVAGMLSTKGGKNFEQYYNEKYAHENKID